MESIFIAIHIINVIILAVLIVLQRPEGDSLGLNAGGLGGSRSATTGLARVTSYVAVIFFITSIALALYSSTANSNRSAIFNKQSTSPAGSTLQQLQNQEQNVPISQVPASQDSPAQSPPAQNQTHSDIDYLNNNNDSDIDYSDGAPGAHPNSGVDDSRNTMDSTQNQESVTSDSHSPIGSSNIKNDSSADFFDSQNKSSAPNTYNNRDLDLLPDSSNDRSQNSLSNGDFSSHKPTALPESSKSSNVNQ